MTTYPAAIDRMAGTLTAPFDAGADRLELAYVSGEPRPQISFAPYDFGEHRARFGTEPRPRYVVTVLADIAVDITMTVRYTATGSPNGSVVFVVPAGTLAGTSLLVPLGADAATAVLKSVSAQAPKGESSPPIQGRFRFSALLGDLAALLWVLGGERDALVAHLNQVRGQRNVAAAAGLSLDLIGSDLGIPRFPPLPYGFAPETIALYHLEDKVETATVVDAMTLYTGAGHPGTRAGATPGVDGRFGLGMGFVYGQSEITVAHHADFALPATDSFTAECFLRPAPGDWLGAVLSKHTDMLDPVKPGWGLHIGAFRGLDRNVRFLLADGTTKIELFADVSLETDRFHHIAGVLDRERGLARLFVNGVLTATKSTTVGVLTNTAPLRIGFAGTPGGGGFSSGFYGALDEVRISRRALTSFAPVLGEDDTSYRQRLALFRRWNLPTPANIRDALNDIVGEINGVTRPITVSDAFVRSPVGSHTVTIRPVTLRPGESIDARGRRGTAESEVCGTIADDQFDARWLVAYDSDRPAYVRDEHRIRQPMRRCLEALMRLVQPDDVLPGIRLSVALYDSNAADLRAVGRAVVLRHPKIGADRLAALAHRAGFSWVQHRAGTADVYASIADTASIEITGPPAGGWYGKDIPVGTATPLGIAPPPPTDSLLRWSLLQAGPGRAELLGSATGKQNELRGRHTGEVTVKLEARLGGKTYSATRRFTMGPVQLDAGATIGGDGSTSVDASIAGAPGDGAYAPEYLVTVDDPALEVATPGSNRMQANVAACLGRLLATVYPPLPAQVRLVEGWNATGAGLDRVGRALGLAPAAGASISLATLAVLAHGAGFDYVENTGTVVRVRHRAGEHIEVGGPTEVDEGSTTSFALARHGSPADAVRAGSALAVANRGASTVSLLDSTSGALLGSVPVAAAPVGIAASANGALVYTASSAARTISAVEVATAKVVAVGPALAAAPLAIVAHPTKPWLVLLLPTQVVIVDTTSFAVVKQWAIPGGSTGKLLSLNPSGTSAWVACTDKTLRVVAVETGAWAAAPTLTAIPLALAVSGTRVYVTAARLLLVINAADGAVVATFDNVDLFPTRVQVDEAAGAVYIGALFDKGVDRRSLTGERQSFVPTPGVPVAVLASGASIFAVLRGPHGGGTDAVATVTTGRITALWPLAPAGGRRTEWTVRPADDASAHFDGATGELAKLTAKSAGAVQIRVRARVDGNPPYTVRVGLDQALLDMERAGTPVVIRRDQYERIMNVLNELHPVGVEFETSVIRSHVLELKAGQLELFPAYTYPTYRLRGQHLARPIGKD